MTKATTQVSIRDMSLRSVNALIRRNYVGRIAYSFRDIVEIRPLHYVFDGKWLFGRTSPGDKLLTLRHNQWVAFEVDEINGPFDWSSAVLHGSFYHLSPDGSVFDKRLFDRAVKLVRGFSPSVLTDEDPVAFRTEFFGISIDRATGRMCREMSPKPRKGRAR